MVAFTTETTVAGPDLARQTARPITESLVDLFGLDEDGWAAQLLDDLIEPALQILLIAVIAWIIVRLARSAIRRTVKRLKEQPQGSGPLGIDLPLVDDRLEDEPASIRRNRRLDALSAVASSSVGFVVWTVAAFTILGTTFGISIGPFVAGAGIIGVALGFGAQDLVKDVLSGLFMLIEDQYGVGDVVDAGEATGVVEGVGLRTTRLRDVTGTLWHVPNGEIRRVGNMSQDWSRALLDIGVGYAADVDQAAEVIKGVADEMATESEYANLFLADPEVWGVESLGVDSVVIRLVIKTQPGEQSAIARELRRRIKLSLDSAEIEIPFPQRTVWVREGNPAALGGQTRDASDPSVAAGKGAAEEGATETSDGHTDPPN